MTARRPVVACRIYDAALTLLPSEFRARYGADMRATFAARCHDANGAAAVAVLLTREVADVAAAAVRIRTPTFRRVSGRKPMLLSLTDVRYALRMLRKQPAFAIVAVLTLALGTGATTAVFTVVNGVLLRPLPFADPERLVLLQNGRNGRLSATFSPPNFRDVSTESGVFAGATAFTDVTANVTGLGEPQQLAGAAVTPSFFEVLGARMRMGRGLIAADGEADAAAVVVVRESLWRTLLGGRSDVVGTTLALDGRPYTVVGVAADELTIPRGADFWRPLVWKPRDIADAARGAQWVGAIARLNPGVSLPQANSAMAVVAERLARDFPRTNKDRAMSAIQLHERMVRGIRPTLLMLFGAVGLVLLMACVNVANLLLARANGRAREVAVRAAVGAARGRLMRQFLVESATLGVIGGAGGLAVAYWATRALVAMAPAGIPRLAELSLDWRVLAFTIAVALATSVAFGLVPAVAATGTAAMAVGGRGVVGSAGSRTRKVLVVAEMALAVILLAGAGLLIRSYARINAVNPGFSPDHVLTFTVGLPEQRYPTSAAAGRFMEDLVARLGRRPGVERAAGIFGLPLDDTLGAHSSFTRVGEADAADSPTAGMRVVTPDYFTAMRIPLLRGRGFDAHDDERGSEVVVVNAEAARRYWPGQDAIGQQLRLGVRLAEARSGMKTIVGVVGDVKYGGLDAAPSPEVYVPYAQHQVESLTFVVRTTGAPEAFIPSARADLAALDRDIPLAAVRTMDDVVGRSIAERRFTMLLLAAFACVAVALAAIGTYGVLAYVVSQRTQEIGVRLAMGASPRDVVALFVREGAALSVAGVIAGIAGALAAARALATLVFGITTTDPSTYAAVAGVLIAVALLASYVPARRAARVDPMTALRSE